MRTFLCLLMVFVFASCRDTLTPTELQKSRLSEYQNTVLPNLEIVSFEAPSVVARTECIGNLTTTVTIRNNTQTSVEGIFNVGLHVSLDSLITKSDPLLTGGRNSIRGIAAGQQRLVTFSGRTHIKPNQPLGAAFLGVIVDEWEQISELDETDNTAWRSIVVRQREFPEPPDLDIASFIAPPEANQGQAIGNLIDLSIRNRTLVDVDTGFYVGVYLSADSSITTSDVPIHRSDEFTITPSTMFCGIAPGLQLDIEPYRLLTVPGDYPLGEAYIGVIVDEFDAIAESVESNNTAARRILIREREFPDLEVVSLTAPDCLAGGDLASDGKFAHLTVRNNGPGDTQFSFRIQFHLRPMFLPTRQYIQWNALISGQEATIPLPLTGDMIHPDFPYGSAHLQVYVDPHNWIEESNESNNAATKAIQVREHECSFAKVAIDVKPGSAENPIRCGKANGVVPVAVLSSDVFDATTVDHTTVTFEGAEEAHIDRQTALARRHQEDVNGDGRMDLLFHFRIAETNLTCESTSGLLLGATFAGEEIRGSDSIRMLGGDSDTSDGAPARTTRL